MIGWSRSQIRSARLSHVTDLIACSLDKSISEGELLNAYKILFVVTTYLDIASYKGFYIFSKSQLRRYVSVDGRIYTKKLIELYQDLDQLVEQIRFICLSEAERKYSDNWSFSGRNPFDFDEFMLDGAKPVYISTSIGFHEKAISSEEYSAKVLARHQRWCEQVESLRLK